MREFAKSYFDDLINNFQSLEASNGAGKNLDIYEGIEKVAQTILSQSMAGKKLMFIVENKLIWIKDIR